MTAATVVQYDIPVPGFASGKATGARDGYTLNTGLGDTVAFFAICQTTADTTMGITSQTGGIVTLSMATNGTAVSADKTIYWFAVRKSR